MNHVNGNRNHEMTIHSFKDIFERVLLPLFSNHDFVIFTTQTQDAYNIWNNKFKLDHRMVEQLPPDERVN